MKKLLVGLAVGLLMAQSVFAAAAATSTSHKKYPVKSVPVKSVPAKPVSTKSMPAKAPLAAMAAISGEMMVKSAKLNIRSKGKMGNNLIGLLKKGDKVTVTKQDGKWCEFEYKSKTGYVFCSLLKK